MIASVRPFSVTGVKKDKFTECAYYPVLAIYSDAVCESFLVRADDGTSDWIMREDCLIVGPI